MQDAVFSLNLALKFVLNSCMLTWTRLHQTGSLWTGQCGGKPRPASPYVRYALFWDII